MDTHARHLAPVMSFGAVGCVLVTGKRTLGVSSPDHMAYRSITSRGQMSDGRLIKKVIWKEKEVSHCLLSGVWEAFERS